MNRIVKLVLAGIAAANFGLLSAFFPIIYLPVFLLFPESGIAANIVSLLICAGIAIGLYCRHAVVRKRQEMEISPYATWSFIGYIAGCVIILFAVVGVDSTPLF